MKLLLKRDFIVFFIMATLFSLIVGNRGETNDTYTYYSIFKNIDYYDLTSFNNFYFETGVELGWGWYSKVISLFSDSPVVLFTVFSFLIFYIIYKISEILKVKYVYVMLFYLPTGFFFMQQFMQIRQALAVPLVIFGSILFLYNKKLSSIIFFILAILFHQISIAYIIVFYCYLFIQRYYPINYSVIRFRLANVFIVFLGFFIVRVFVLPIATSSFTRLEAYSNTSYAETVGFMSLANIKFYIEFLLILFLTNKKNLANRYYVFLVFSFTIGLTLRLAFYDFAILSGRLSNVFLFVEVFLMPMLLLARLKRPYFYFYAFIYFFFLLCITWFFQVSEYLEDAYFIPLS